MDDRVYPVIFPTSSSSVHSPRGLERRPTAEGPGTPSRFKHNQQQQQPSGDSIQPQMNRDQVAPTQRRQILQYGSRQPLRRERSPIAVLLVVAYLGALAYYLYGGCARPPRPLACCAAGTPGKAARRAGFCRVEGAQRCVAAASG
jgi:hypothetical protein